jgi:hypothetical protein
MTPLLKGKSIGSHQKTVLNGQLTKQWGEGPRYSPTQGFNLLQISRNWFPGNWILDPRLKWASGMHLLGTLWNILYFVRRVVMNLPLRVKPLLHCDAAACWNPDKTSMFRFVALSNLLFLFVLSPICITEFLS